MPTQLIRAHPAEQLDIRCGVADVIVANLAVNIVLFFPRALDTRALAMSFARALDTFPIFDGRLALVRGEMRIRCPGRGIPFTTMGSNRTLHEAVRTVSDDEGHWLLDAVNGATTRWGLGPLCRVRVTRLAGDATAIGFSWHHALGDMQTFVHFMNAWTAAADGASCPEPLIVGDRAAYLDEHLPASDARTPGVRFLGLAETARSVFYLATGARQQRTLTLYFGDDEIARMRRYYGHRMHLSANDVVCGHVCEALMSMRPTANTRTLAVAVNARSRCDLDPMLAGNVITTLNLQVRRGEDAESIAERIRHAVDRFADDHCDMRVNQRALDDAGAWRGLRCVSTAVDASRWNPVVTNLSGFGLYQLQFEGTRPTYCTPLIDAPVAGIGALIEGFDGHGLVFHLSLPPREFQAMSDPAIRAHLHRFRIATDAIPRLHREIHSRQ